MNYFTATIPTVLAEKLKEKGMPITMSYHFHQPEPNVKGFVRANFKEIDCPTYAEVFDWLMGKRVSIAILFTGDYTAKKNRYTLYMSWNDYGREGLITMNTWRKAADAAIEKSLTLI